MDCHFSFVAVRFGDGNYYKINTIYLLYIYCNYRPRRNYFYGVASVRIL